MASKMPNRMWIVGVCREKGKHTYRCFDNDLVSAREYADVMIGKGYKVSLWDMLSDRRMI